MKVKIIEANMPERFEESLNAFCGENIKIRDIKYITSRDRLSGYNYSAMVLYDDIATYGYLMKKLDIEYERKVIAREQQYKDYYSKKLNVQEVNIND